MFSFFHARQLIVDTVSSVETEKVELLDCYGRVVDVIDAGDYRYAYTSNLPFIRFQARQDEWVAK